MNPNWITAILSATGAVFGICQWWISFGDPAGSGLARALDRRDAHRELANRLDAALTEEPRSADIIDMLRDGNVADRHRNEAEHQLFLTLLRADSPLTPKFVGTSILAGTGYGWALLSLGAEIVMVRGHAPRAAVAGAAWSGLLGGGLGLSMALWSLSLYVMRDREARKVVDRVVSAGRELSSEQADSD